MDMSSFIAGNGALIIGIVIAILIFVILFSFNPIVAIVLYTLFGCKILYDYLKGIFGSDMAQWIILGIILGIIVLFIGIIFLWPTGSKTQETTVKEPKFSPKYRYLSKEELFSGGENRKFFPQLVKEGRNIKVSIKVSSYEGYKNPQDKDEEWYNQFSYENAHLKQFKLAVGGQMDHIMHELEHFCAVQYPDFPIWEPWRKAKFCVSDEEGIWFHEFTLEQALNPDRVLRREISVALSSLERGKYNMADFQGTVKELQAYHKCVLVIESDPEKVSNLLPADWKLKKVLTKCYQASADQVKEYMEKNEILL